jgi:hypothetical protein
LRAPVERLVDARLPEVLREVVDLRVDAPPRDDADRVEPPLREPDEAERPDVERADPPREDELLREREAPEEPDERDEDEEREDDDFVSPDCARCLLTVRAAISLARFVERPCFFSESLTCSY